MFIYFDIFTVVSTMGHQELLNYRIKDSQELKELLTKLESMGVYNKECDTLLSKHTQ